MNQHATPHVPSFQGKITDGLDVATALNFASDFLREQTSMPAAQVPVAIASGRILSESVDLPLVGPSDAAPRGFEYAALRAMISHIAPSVLSLDADRSRDEDGMAFLSEGALLSPTDVGLLAAMGMAGVWVRRKMPVAVLSLDATLIDPGTKKKRGRGYDAVRPMLISALKMPWISANDLGIVGEGDRVQRLVLEQSVSKNRVLLAGGIKDESDAAALKNLLVDLGGIILVNRVTIAPGQSAFLATLGGTLVITLPANPVGAWNVFTVLANPIIRAAAHLKPSADPGPKRFAQMSEVEGAALLSAAI